MKSEHLIKMLDMLTGAYTRVDLQRAKQELTPITNIGKLFSIFASRLDMIKEHIERIRLWDNLDYAEGSVLDRYGANFGVFREGTSDNFYRLLIKVKMISQLSGGDIDTVINAVATMYGIEPLQVKFEEIFPAKIKVTVQATDIGVEQMQAVEIIARLIKRIIAAGVGFYTVIETKIITEGSLKTAALAQNIISGTISEKSISSALYPLETKNIPISTAHLHYLIQTR